MKKQEIGKTILSIVIGIVAFIFLLPVLIVLMNSFKANTSINTAAFAFPNGETFVGLSNYINGMTFGNYPFWKSALFTSRAAGTAKPRCQAIKSIYSSSVISTGNSLFIK